MRRVLQIVLPLLVLAAGGGGLWLLIELRPAATPAAQQAPVPVVRALETRMQTVQITVHTQGNVEPRTEIDLVPEVSGKIV